MYTYMHAFRLYTQIQSNRQFISLDKYTVENNTRARSVKIMTTTILTTTTITCMGEKSVDEAMYIPHHNVISPKSVGCNSTKIR